MIHRQELIRIFYTILTNLDSSLTIEQARNILRQMIVDTIRRLEEV